MDRLSTQEVMLRAPFDTAIALSVLSPCTQGIHSNYFWYQWVKARTGTLLHSYELRDWKGVARFVEAGVFDSNRVVEYSGTLRKYTPLELDLITLAASLGVHRGYVLLESMGTPCVEVNTSSVCGMWVHSLTVLNCELALLVYKQGFTSMREEFAIKAILLCDKRALEACTQMGYTYMELYALASKYKDTYTVKEFMVDNMTSKECNALVTKMLRGDLRVDDDVMMYMLRCCKISSRRCGR